MHVLVFVAHVAWNRATQGPDELEETFQADLSKFPLPRSKIRRELVTKNWEQMLSIMLDYKRKHFANARRIVAVCGYTPRETFMVAWK